MEEDQSRAFQSKGSRAGVEVNIKRDLDEMLGPKNKQNSGHYIVDQKLIHHLFIYLFLIRFIGGDIINNII